MAIDTLYLRAKYQFDRSLRMVMRISQKDLFWVSTNCTSFSKKSTWCKLDNHSTSIALGPSSILTFVFSRTPWHRQGSSMEWIPTVELQDWFSSLWTILPSLLTAVHPASRQRIPTRASKPTQRKDSTASRFQSSGFLVSLSNILFWFSKKLSSYIIHIHPWTFHVRVFSPFASSIRPRGAMIVVFHYLHYYLWEGDESARPQKFLSHQRKTTHDSQFNLPVSLCPRSSSNLTPACEVYTQSQHKHAGSSIT